MRSIYFHLVGGAAGDMLLASLMGLGCPLGYLKKEFKKLNIEFRIRETNQEEQCHIPKKKLVFEGSRFSYYKDIVRIIKNSKLDNDVKAKALGVYEILAGAERKVHKEKEKPLHFHHLGEIDAVLEICGFFIALKYFKIEQVLISSLPMSFPAPATLEILKGKKINIVNFPYETVTPTAAALLQHAQYQDAGFSYKDYAIAWGSCSDTDYLVAYLSEENLDRDKIIKIETNIDDMNPQIFEPLFDVLYKAGAKEVYLEQVVMKKSRPAVVLNVLCQPQAFIKLREIIFKHTSTFGVRYQEYNRDKVKSEFVYRQTKFGKIKFRRSLSELKKETPEYRDCKRIAEKFNLPLLEVYRQIR